MVYYIANILLNDQKYFMQKILTVFVNTAVFVKNKEQFWNRACYFGMHSKKQSGFHKNSIVGTNSSSPHLPLTQGCCGDHQTDRPKTPHLVVQNRNRNSKRVPGSHPQLLTSSTWNYRPKHQHFQSKTPETTAQMQNGLLLAYHKHLKAALNILTTNLTLLQALNFSSSSV